MTMTLKEIEISLPNGFHDSLISTINIDYVNASVRIEIAIWNGEMVKDDAEREKWRSAILVLNGLQYFTIEPPDERYLYSRPQAIDVDMGDPKTKPTLPSNIPANAFAESFFVSDWNCFIHLAALDANLTWVQ